MTRLGRPAVFSWVLLAPAIVLFCLFTAWPLAEVVRLSFLKTNFISTRFVGLDNFVASMSDHYFIQSVINSGCYILIIVPSMLVVSLGFALLLDRVTKRWQDLSRVFIYLPTLSAGIIIANLWKWVFTYDGLANWLVSLVGLEPVSWFAQGGTAIPVVSFIVVYASFGGNVIFFLSAIQGVSKDHIEAAQMDGAHWWQVQWHIVLPMIKSTIFMVGLLTALASMMIYETIFMLAPYDYSATITYNIYLQGFQFSKYGMASAQALMLMAISVGLFLVKRRIEK
jgi:ABC-type sugar transport system permease subunit